MIIIQYLIALLNLTNEQSPQSFPEQLNQHLATSDVTYAIPISDLATDEKFALHSFLYCTDYAQFQGIWIDFVLLLLISYHQKVYKKSINSQMIPEVKNIAKKLLMREDELEVEKRKLRNANKKLPDEEPMTERQAITEYEMIKKECSSSRWMLRINFARIMTQHVFIASMVCFLLMMNVSIISLVILPIFLYILYYSNEHNFVRNQLEKLVQICLIILLVDFIVFMIYQTPFTITWQEKLMTSENKEHWERMLLWFRYIGWEDIWNRRHGPTSILNIRPFVDFIGKAAVICLMFA